MNVTWTPALEARLVQLLKGGDTYEAIAKTLSREFHIKLNKNACIGKGRRLQVPLRMPARKKKCRKRNALRSHERRRVNLVAARLPLNPGLGKRKLRAHPLRQKKRRLPPQNKQKDLTLLQLLPTSCRWPNGNNAPYLFCGAHKAPGSSYCLHHALIASPNHGRVR